MTTKRYAAAAVVLMMEMAGLATAAVFVVADGSAFPDAHHVALAVGGGAMGITGLGLFYSALAAGPMSIVAPLGALGSVVGVAVGLLTGDTLTLMVAAGMALALVGALLAGREHDTSPAGQRRGVLLALAASACFGGYFVLFNGAADGGPVAWAVGLARLPALPLAGALVLLRRSPLPAGADLRRTLIVGNVDCLGAALVGYALAHGELSVVSVLASLYPVATVLLARFVLHERLERIQALGIVAALSGVALVTAGSA